VKVVVRGGWWGAMRAGRAGVLWLAWVVIAVARADAQTAAGAGSPFAAAMRTDLGESGSGLSKDAEIITVFGKRPAFRDAPGARYGEERAPWEMDRAIRDTMTGADTAAFGNAYNLGSVLGSDERSNETGGPFLAPRHQ
jgi:hypothetical protein